MDSRIQELINLTRVKFGLYDYHLQRHSFSRYVNIFNETVYRFGMGSGFLIMSQNKRMMVQIQKEQQ